MSIKVKFFIQANNRKSNAQLCQPVLPLFRYPSYSQFKLLALEMEYTPIATRLF